MTTDNARARHEHGKPDEPAAVFVASVALLWAIWRDRQGYTAEPGTTPTVAAWKVSRQQQRYYPPAEPRQPPPGCPLGSSARRMK